MCGVIHALRIESYTHSKTDQQVLKMINLKIIFFEICLYGFHLTLTCDPSTLDDVKRLTVKNDCVLTLYLLSSTLEMNT